MPASRRTSGMLQSSRYKSCTVLCCWRHGVAGYVCRRLRERVRPVGESGSAHGCCPGKGLSREDDVRRYTALRPPTNQAPGCMQDPFVLRGGNGLAPIGWQCWLGCGPVLAVVLATQIRSILVTMATRCSSSGSLGRNAGGAALAFCGHAAGCTCTRQPQLYRTAKSRSGTEESSPGIPQPSSCSLPAAACGPAGGIGTLPSSQGASGSALCSVFDPSIYAQCKS